MHRLLRNIGWLLTGRGLNAVLSIIYLALATRTLGLDHFGYFAIILALGQTVTGLANFQTWQFVVRWGADEDGPADATGFAIALDLLSVALGLVLAALLVGSAPLWLPLPDELLPVAFGYCVISLLAIRTTPTGLLRLRFAYARTTAAEAVQPVVRAAGAAAAAIAMPTVTGFILAWAAAEIAVAISLWIAAGRLERINLSRISLRHIPRAHPGAWQPQCWRQASADPAGRRDRRRNRGRRVPRCQPAGTGARQPRADGLQGDLSRTRPCPGNGA